MRDRYFISRTQHFSNGQAFLKKGYGLLILSQSGIAVAYIIIAVGDINIRSIASILIYLQRLQVLVERGLVLLLVKEDIAR